MKVIKIGDIEIKGPEEKITNFLKELNTEPPDGYYFSESKGLLEISEMNTYHLVNAILKRYREWVSDLSKVSENPSKVLEMLKQGPSNDGILGSLTIELIKKVNNANSN